MDVRSEGINLSRNELSRIFLHYENFPDLAVVAAQHMLTVLPNDEATVQGILTGIGSGRMETTSKRLLAAKTMADGDLSHEDMGISLFTFYDWKDTDPTEFTFPVSLSRQLGSFCLHVARFEQEQFSDSYARLTGVERKRDEFEEEHPTSRPAIIERFLPKFSWIARNRKFLSESIEYYKGNMEHDLADYTNYRESFYRILASLPEDQRAEIDTELPKDPLLIAPIT